MSFFLHAIQPTNPNFNSFSEIFRKLQKRTNLPKTHERNRNSVVSRFPTSVSQRAKPLVRRSFAPYACRIFRCIRRNTFGRFIMAFVCKSRIGVSDGETLERKSVRTQQSNHTDRNQPLLQSECNDCGEVSGLSTLKLYVSLTGQTTDGRQQKNHTS